jgi:hypothetical protein
MEVRKEIRPRERGEGQRKLRKKGKERKKVRELRGPESRT